MESTNQTLDKFNFKQVFRCCILQIVCTKMYKEKYLKIIAICRRYCLLDDKIKQKICNLSGFKEKISKEYFLIKRST